MRLVHAYLRLSDLVFLPHGVIECDPVRGKQRQPPVLAADREKPFQLSTPYLETLVRLE
jgi:hypothetical protein